MSRIGGEQIVTPPRNNVYTVLALAGLVMAILGLIVLFSRAKEVMGVGALTQ